MFDKLHEDFEETTIYKPRLPPRVGSASFPVMEFEFNVAQQQRAPKIDPDIFCLLCKMVINEGMASQQGLRKLFGNAIPKGAEKTEERWAVPDPATMRDILTFFSTLTPAASTGSRLPWRHGQCAQAEAEPKLPNWPRRAMAHQPR